MAQSPTILSFRANQAFILPLGMSQWAALYDLTLGEYRFQIRTIETNPVIVYAFDNLGGVSPNFTPPYPSSPASAAQGSITYDPVSQVLHVETSYAEVKRFLQTAGVYVYDLQYTIRDVTGAVIFVRDLAFGTLTVTNGVVRS